MLVILQTFLRVLHQMMLVFWLYLSYVKWTFLNITCNTETVLGKSFNDACTKEGECGKTLYCARSVCQCASSDYWNGSTCSLSIYYHYSIVGYILCLIGKSLFEIFTWIFKIKFNYKLYINASCLIWIF